METKKRLGIGILFAGRAANDPPGRLADLYRSQGFHDADSPKGFEGDFRRFGSEDKPFVPGAALTRSIF